MKWRCTWCGKPHAADDPPCESCGHNTFEKAVVQQGKAEPSPTETVDTGTTYVWRCEDCGRNHVKNNPPCSRCHGHDLRKVEQTYDDVERDLDTPSWLEVAKPYLPVFAVVGLVVVLFATGILSPTILPGIGSPSPPDAPGEGAEAAGIDLEATERTVHERLDAERDGGETSADADLAAFAEYQNRAFVAQEYEGTEPEPAGLDEFGVDCSVDPVGGPVSLGAASIDDYDDDAALADDVAAALLAAEFGDGVTAGPPSEGLDIHAGPDGTLYVFYAGC